MHYVKDSLSSAPAFHIHHNDPANTDNDTHTACGKHWFYERTYSRVERPPLELLCEDCFEAAYPASQGFPKLVEQELIKARNGHANLHSHHEAYSVILDELDEYWEEVRNKREARDPIRILEELVQIAAMCQRAAEDLELA